MSITPQPGYIVDPSNPNGVIPDPAGSTVVTPPANPSNLQGTMTTTQQQPQTPVVDPTKTAQTGTPVPPGAGLDPASFMAVIGGVKQNFAANNDLIKQKNLLVKGLFTSPLTPEQVAQLPTDVQQVWNSGNKDAIQLQIQALNERIQGGTNNFAQSVNYLVNGYQTAVTQAEKQKTDALSTVQNFVAQYGSRAGEALKSLYGQPYLDTLKTMGIDIGNFAAIPTLTQIKNNNDANAGGGTPANYNGEFGATIDLAANIAGLSNAQRAETKSMMQNFIANGDYDSAYTQILSSTAAKLKGTAATTFQQQANSVGVLDDLKTALKAYSDAGGKTNIFKGTTDQIQTKIGTLMTDPKYAALAVQLNAAFQNYRLQMTGAAFGVKESAEYASILPSPGNTLDLNLAKIEGASNYLNSSIESSIRNEVGQGGVEIKKYAEGAVPQGQGGSDDVSVISPDGVEGTIPKDQLQEALSNGYKLPAGPMDHI